MRLPWVVQFDAGMGGRAGCEADAAQTEKAVAGFEMRGGQNLPAGSGKRDAAVLIPRPGFGQQDEAVPCVAEMGLQLRPDIAGDQVGGGGRIAVMRDAGNGVRLFPLGAPERCIEMVQNAVSVFQERSYLSFYQTNRRVDLNRRMRP